MPVCNQVPQPRTTTTTRSYLPQVYPPNSFVMKLILGMVVPCTRRNPEIVGVCIWSP